MFETRQFPVDFGGKSYDLDAFLRDHPGGVNTLKPYKGKSVLEAMARFGHSTSAYHILDDFATDSVGLSVSGNGRIVSDACTRDLKEIKLLEDLEAKLDWSKPLLNQLEIIAPHYQKWVHSAVYRKCRLFENPLMEMMTFTPWYLVPMFWIPTILYLGYMQLAKHVLCGASCQDPLTLVQFTWHLMIGVFTWTLVEYCLHRWIFHLDPGTSLTLIRTHFLIHGVHHKVPFDGLRQVFPPVAALVIALMLYMPVSLVFSYPRIVMTGGLVGYLTYDMIHFYVHHGSPRDGSYLYAMKRYHSNHHFVNQDQGFGISCKIWDLVFRTKIHIKDLGFSLCWSRPK